MKEEHVPAKVENTIASGNSTDFPHIFSYMLGGTSEIGFPLPFVWLVDHFFRRQSPLHLTDLGSFPVFRLTFDHHVFGISLQFFFIVLPLFSGQQVTIRGFRD